jgi:transcriptional regulator with XRE-family HTH domain
METFAERMAASLSTQIRVELTERRMSQADLAEAAGVGRPAMNRYLMAHQSMPMPTFYKIAETLAVAPHVLLQRAEARLSSDASLTT